MRVEHVLVGVWISVAGSLALGVEPVISHFGGDGVLGVSGLETGSWVRVEWASSLTGTWHRSWQGLGNQEAQTNTTLTLEAPLYYRVVSSSEPRPSGMALVDAGPFRMGNVDTNDFGVWWYAREVPAHTVDVSAFYVDRYEVSNEQMRQVMQRAYDEGVITATVSGVTNAVGEPQELLNLDSSDAEISFTNGVFSVEAGRENFPCVMVTWYGAMAYCSYRNTAEGLDPTIDLSDWSCDFSGSGYRLPTEAEWEKAARGGLVGYHYPWHRSMGAYSNVIDGAQANYENSGDPYNRSTPLAYYNGSQSPVGQDMANGFGIYDMAGNVYEWCWDRYSSVWYGRAEASAKDTAGPPTGTTRVLRGGAWYRTPEYLRCSFRHNSTPEFSYRAFGFRCVRRLP